MVISDVRHRDSSLKSKYEVSRVKIAQKPLSDYPWQRGDPIRKFNKLGLFIYALNQPKMQICLALDWKLLEVKQRIYLHVLVTFA